MTRLTDYKRKVDIMMIDNKGYSFDNDFFSIGSLPYDDDWEAYVVPDVACCINQAEDCKNHTGDFIDCEDDDFMLAYYDLEI